MKIFLAFGTIAAIGYAVSLFSFCPSRSFAIGSVIGISGSAACHQADLEREANENPTEKILKGGI